MLSPELFKQLEAVRWRNSVAKTAGGRAAAEGKREMTAAVRKATTDMFASWPGARAPTTSKRKKKNRFPGV